MAFWAFLTLAVMGSIGLWVRGFGQRPVPKCLLAGFSSELQVCLFPKFSYLKDSGNRNTSHSVGMGFGDPQHVMRSGFEVFSLLSLAYGMGWAVEQELELGQIANLRDGHHAVLRISTVCLSQTCWVNQPAAPYFKTRLPLDWSSLAPLGS